MLVLPARKAVREPLTVVSAIASASTIPPIETWIAQMVQNMRPLMFNSRKSRLRAVYIYIYRRAQQLIWHVRQVAGSPPTLCSRWAAPGQVKEQTIGLKLVPIQCLGTTRTANYVRGTKQ